MNDMSTDHLDTIRAARAYLLGVAEPPAPALNAFIDTHGPVVAAQRIAARDAPTPVLDITSARHSVNGDDDIAAMAGIGARLVIPEDAEWPDAQLRPLTTCAPSLRCPGTPIALWVRGPANLAEVLQRAVTITGARAATGYGEYVASDFAYSLAEHGHTIVSGASFGIDGAAHRGALNAEGTTIAVVACGIDVPYPAGHQRLLGNIAERGAVVSEYPPRSHPTRHRFLVRSRLLAASGAATVIVEAGIRSGSKLIAATAAQLGKPALAVPGPITSVVSVGCHSLMREGMATPVTTVEEILAAITPDGQGAPR
ncbi:Rossmann fold nucleotide-binding protein Smf possibly involved in DNA uptake [Alloactinosynnema sp. L-07]|uniref:DNA-processing protein DprA n=1 Tax=Alloactinosynnema sp. L-07 TaxID=1653480 RepID=UPI00065EFF61|nr:DNA-processing protein DprA [Alloactinosynnema sp. L-07]CRK59181.1 Rossmann fold nucleotide-binding protein Smf possibly involved in DNA uptake [Alloactinosynnema sp. L-07]